jgi:hypothetical protein
MNIFSYLLEPLHWFSKDFIIEEDVVYFLDTTDRVLPNIIRTGREFDIYKAQSTQDGIVSNMYIGRVLNTDGEIKKG